MKLKINWQTFVWCLWQFWYFWINYEIIVWVYFLNWFHLGIWDVCFISASNLHIWVLLCDIYTCKNKNISLYQEWYSIMRFIDGLRSRVSHKIKALLRNEAPCGKYFQICLFIGRRGLVCGCRLRFMVTVGKFGHL